MFSLSATKIFVGVEPVDMRKSYNGLYSVIREKLKEDPASGAFFVFTNKRRNRLKIYKVEESGPWICCKRLEQGTFSWPEPSNADSKIRLAPEALHLILHGIEMRTCYKKAWYEDKR